MRDAPVHWKCVCCLNGEKFLGSMTSIVCQQGLLSKSQGKGEQRFITVSKRQEVTAETTSLKKKKMEISVEPDVQRVLQQHLDAYPEVPTLELQACPPTTRRRPKP